MKKLVIKNEKNTFKDFPFPNQPLPMLESYSKITSNIILFGKPGKGKSNRKLNTCGNMPDTTMSGVIVGQGGHGKTPILIEKEFGKC